MNLPALFLKLVNMSISASWLVLAVLVLRLMIRKAPKWMTCSLWALVALRLVIPFSIESIFSLIPSTQTLPPEIITGNRFEINTGIPVVNQQINDVILDHYYEGVTVPVDHGLNTMSIASLVWLTGLVLLVLYSIVSYLRLRRRVAASIHLRDRIYLCDYIESPFILGILRPRIYLPSTLEQTNWPHVLAHEQAHLQRRDHWWKPFGFALLCIHWFNPLLWLAYVLLCRDIELACDEKVIQGFGDSGKAAYSKALLECSMPRYLIAACPLAFGEVGVKDRVKSILNYKKPAFWVILIALILSITAAVCFLTDPVTEPEAEFIATVIGTYPNYISVEPHPDSNEAKSSHQIHVTLPKNTPAIQNGDTVRIVYDGVILESSPAQITGASLVEVLTDLKYVSENYSLTRAILENYVVMVDSDVVSGQELMHEFFRKTENREPASIRYATYFTIGDPDRMSDELFESSRANYPAIYFHELSYDGNEFTLRWFEGDTEYVQTWKYLLRFEGKPASPSVSFMAFDGYMLTDRNDVTYEMVWNGMFSADFRDQIPFKEVYRDYLYNNEPTLEELEAAKLELEPYMVRYRIASIDANELTGRLDIQVYEWVDGLFDLIEQHVSRHFVTVTELRGTLEFTEDPDPLDSYRNLPTEKGLELYALEDGGFVLMAGTNRIKTEEEIRYSPLASTEEMRAILAEYNIPAEHIFIDNRSGLSEEEIRDALGISLTCRVSVELLDVCSTAAIIEYRIEHPSKEVIWTGYDYYLEILTETGWNHYGYPSEELAWETAFLLYHNPSNPAQTEKSLIVETHWSRVAGAPLPPGTYRYCKSFVFEGNGTSRSQIVSVEFKIPGEQTEDWGLHLEILNPTENGATLALTCSREGTSQFTTQGKYYLMVDVGNSAYTTYGLLPDQLTWDDILYTLKPGETIYWNVLWSHTTQAPLPVGSYRIIIEADQAISSAAGQTTHYPQYISGSFAIID